MLIRLGGPREPAGRIAHQNRQGLAAGPRSWIPARSPARIRPIVEPRVACWDVKGRIGVAISPVTTAVAASKVHR
jgi:hypothetical protein